MIHMEHENFLFFFFFKYLHKNVRNSVQWSWGILENSNSNLISFEELQIQVFAHSNKKIEIYSKIDGAIYWHRPLFTSAQVPARRLHLHRIVSAFSLWFILKVTDRHACDANWGRYKAVTVLIGIRWWNYSEGANWKMKKCSRNSSQIHESLLFSKIISMNFNKIILLSVIMFLFHFRARSLEFDNFLFDKVLNQFIGASRVLFSI